MFKKELIKILGYKSCHICHIVFTQGGEITCIDWVNSGLKQTVYHFCERHSPPFCCNLALGTFGEYYRTGLKCFCWFFKTTDTSSYWAQIEPEKVKEWLDKIYST